MPPLLEVWHLAVGALVGLAVGVEREHSGKASGPDARFAGVRTFLLLGLLGGLSGWLLVKLYFVAAAILLGGGVMFCIVAYVMTNARLAGSSHAGADGTTEVAALLVLGLSAVAGLGQTTLAAAVTAVVLLALGEKERVHWLVGRIDDAELRGALQFAVLALVVLPLLPDDPFGPFGGIRPRSLWLVVLLISGLNFLAFLLHRVVGARAGHALSGALGGLVSSTAVTLGFTRESRRSPVHSASLGAGIVAACMMPIPRAIIVAAIVNVSMTVPLALRLAPALLIAAAVVVGVIRRSLRGAEGEEQERPQNPLRLLSAIKLAAIIQLALLAVNAVRTFWGDTGVLASGALLGLANVDALTLAMARLESVESMPDLAARAIVLGVATSTMLKLTIVLVGGTPALRRAAAPWLAAITAVLVASAFVLPAGMVTTASMQQHQPGHTVAVQQSQFAIDAVVIAQHVDRAHATHAVRQVAAAFRGVADHDFDAGVVRVVRGAEQRQVPLLRSRRVRAILERQDAATGCVAGGEGGEEVRPVRGVA